MAKIYYNDNGTWKVVDIAGGGGGGSSNVVESPLTIGTGIQTLKIHKAGYIEYTNPNQHMKFNLPLYSAQGTVDNGCFVQNVVWKSEYCWHRQY